MKRIMVDMSATLIHHGHIRLIKKAAEYGQVIIGLTRDDEIIASKGYKPELPYASRKEILEAINGVIEVVSTPWLINEKELDKYNIDLLIHGDDNSNQIPSDRLLVLPRTKGVSSTQIRENACKAIIQKNNQKLMLTPGPATLLHENIKYLKPLFGRGDTEYQNIYNSVTEWIKKISGQDELIVAQGSATFGLELAAHSFVSGRILLIVTGYYSKRLEELLPADCQVTQVDYKSFYDTQGEYDWVLCAYTETSTAFKADLPSIKEKTNKLGAKLFVDSTGSIGLEEHHELCDVTAFSSCKGLFGLTGAAFIAHKKSLAVKSTKQFYFNYQTQLEHMTTGPYHALASLYGVMNNHDKFKSRVIKSKTFVLEHYKNYIIQEKNQPLLCTYLNANIKAKDENVILYSPRSQLPGSIICHFGEIHHDKVGINKRIEIIEINNA